MPREAVNAPDAPKPVGPYSQAVKFGKFIFVSGQVPLDPATSNLYVSSTENQTKRIMENIKAILAAAGAGMENVVKTTIYLKDLNEMKFVNNVYAMYFGNNPPARSAVQVSRLPKEAQMEIEVIALLD